MRPCFNADDILGAGMFAQKTNQGHYALVRLGDVRKKNGFGSDADICIVAIGTHITQTSVWLAGRGEAEWLPPNSRVAADYAMFNLPPHFLQSAGQHRGRKLMRSVLRMGRLSGLWRHRPQPH